MKFLVRNYVGLRAGTSQAVTTKKPHTSHPVVTLPVVSEPTASDILCFQMANNDIHIFSHITILCRFHQPNKNKSVTYTLTITLSCIKVSCNNWILFYEVMFTSSIGDNI